MIESLALLALLSVLSLCAVVGTTVLCLTAADLRRMFSQMNRFLSHGQETFREAERALSASRHFMDRTDRTMARVHQVIDKGCEVAEDALEEVDLFREKTHAFWTRYLGNGSRPRSRRLEKRR